MAAQSRAVVKPQLQTEIEQREWLDLKALRRCFQSKRTATNGLGNNHAGSRSEQIDHQYSQPAGGAGDVLLLPVSPRQRPGPPSADQSNYFCRGCSARLPLGFRGHFHTSVFGQTSGAGFALGAYMSGDDLDSGY